MPCKPLEYRGSAGHFVLKYIEIQLWNPDKFRFSFPKDSKIGKSGSL